MQFKLDNADLRIEWYSGTGCGGQYRNKHQNSCRITHIPSGAIVTAQCRSRQNSLNEARAEMVARLEELARSKHLTQNATIRKEQVGSGMRGDKIRTIRFQDNTVTDHVTGKRMPADKYLKGNIDLLW